MIEGLSASSSGLRERKKVRTRAVIVNACGDLVADTKTVQLGPTVMVDRLNEAFEHVAVMASDLQCPPSGADYERMYG